MALDDRTKAAFDAASDTVKQLLTLATGSIGGAIALFDDKNQAGIGFGRATPWVDGGLISLALSVAFGLLAMGALTGQLGSELVAVPSTYSPTLRLMTMLQMGGFGLGIIMLVVAAM